MCAQTNSTRGVETAVYRQLSQTLVTLLLIRNL